jgi:hypothetical protein
VLVKGVDNVVLFLVHKINRLKYFISNLLTNMFRTISHLLFVVSSVSLVACATRVEHVSVFVYLAVNHSTVTVVICSRVNGGRTS